MAVKAAPGMGGNSALTRVGWPTNVGWGTRVFAATVSNGGGVSSGTLRVDTSVVAVTVTTGVSTIAVGVIRPETLDVTVGTTVTCTGRVGRTAVGT
jgi:hypothetical protein